MDGIKREEAFTITRDDREIGELTPSRRPRRFVRRVEFVQVSRTAPSVDLDAFRQDQDLVLDGDLDDPWVR